MTLQRRGVYTSGGMVRDAPWQNGGEFLIIMILLLVFIIIYYINTLLLYISALLTCCLLLSILFYELSLHDDTERRNGLYFALSLFYRI